MFFDESNSWLTTSTRQPPITENSIREMLVVIGLHKIEKAVAEMHRREQRQLLRGVKEGETFYYLEDPFPPAESSESTFGGRVIVLMTPDKTGRRGKNATLVIPSAEWRKMVEVPK